MSLVELRGASDHVSVHVRPDRGAEIAQINVAGRGLLGAWPSPGACSAEDAGKWEVSQQAWLAQYRGGWQELFPSTGAASSVEGRRYPFHGQASRQPWECLEMDERSLRARWSDEDTLLVMQRNLAIDRFEQRVELVTTVKNGGSEVRRVLWGHHPAFQLIAPSTLRFPCCGVESAACVSCHGSMDDAVSSDPGSDLRCLPVPAGWVVLIGGDGVRLRLTWDGELFPFLWIWREVAVPSWPFTSSTSSIALEPQRSSVPGGLKAAIESEEHLVLEPGTSMESRVSLEIWSPDPSSDPGVKGGDSHAA